MSSGPQRSRRDNWVADFETTTDPNDCRVWGWAITPVYHDSDNDVEFGNTIDDFIAKVSQLNGKVYFHNLEFDGKFVLDYLLKNGFKHSADSKDKLRAGEFTTIISDMGRFYSITVKFSNRFRIEFRDSLKKLPMTVERIAKSFNLEMLKGSIDYHAFRPIGYEMTDEEKEYVRNDVLIVAKALRVQLDSGMTKLTVGSDSLAEYKGLFGKSFDTIFPILPKSMDDDIRHAYRGGWTMPAKRFRGKVLKTPVRVYDVNSLYPSVMRYKLLPWGMPRWFDGMPPVDDEYPLYVASVTFTAHLKPDHVPCIQLRNHRFNYSEYSEVIDMPVTMTATNVDLELWAEQYDLEILAWEGGWQFKGTYGLFDSYIDKWMAVKTTSEGGLKELAKLHLNNLYGKFATNPDVTPKIPVLVDDVVKYVKGNEELRDPVYTAAGVFITSYARDTTIRAAQENYEIFAYADTDSLHLLTDSDPTNLDIDPIRLGAWKFEGAWDAAIYVRPKCYTEWRRSCLCPNQPHADGRCYNTRIAGLPETIRRRITFADYYNDHVFDDKLVPATVPGGVVLRPMRWKLSDDYLPDVVDMGSLPDLEWVTTN